MSREKAARKFLTELIENAYDGSAMSLVLQALSSGKASQEEIDKARRLLDRMESNCMYCSRSAVSPIVSGSSCCNLRPTFYSVSLVEVPCRLPLVGGFDSWFHHGGA